MFNTDNTFNLKRPNKHVVYEKQQPAITAVSQTCDF